MIPKLTHNQVMDFQSWSIGKGIILALSLRLFFLQYLPHLINFPLQFLSCPSPPPHHPLHLPGRHPYPLQIQTLLFPPPNSHSWPCPPLRRQTQVHNGPSHNILRHGVLVVVDVGIHLLQHRLHHRILQKGVHPSSVLSLPRLPFSQPAGNPMVESA